jgi:hypothetical protein
MLGDQMGRSVFVVAFLCCATLCFSALAANQPIQLGMNQISQGNYGFNGPTANPSASTPVAAAPVSASATSAPVSYGNFTVLQQDSGTNLTIMNLTFTNSPAYSWEQAVEFKTPRPSWILEGISVLATDSWNASSEKQPISLPFNIEVRDEKFNLLYTYEGIQLPYFTHSKGAKIATIDISPMHLNGTFYVCFNGYEAIPLAAELQNATGNSYYYDERTAQLYSGVLPSKNGQTIPVNWIIRAVGI